MRRVPEGEGASATVKSRLGLGGGHPRGARARNASVEIAAGLRASALFPSDSDRRLRRELLRFPGFPHEL